MSGNALFEGSNPSFPRYSIDTFGCYVYFLRISVHMQKICIEKRRNAIVPPNDSERIAPAGDIQSGIDKRDNPNKKLLLTSSKD